MKKLKVEFTQHKNVVLMEVLDMDESLRGIGDIYTYENMILKSNITPQLLIHEVYLWGSCREHDGLVDAYSFNSIEGATNYINRANRCIEAYNKSIECGFEDEQEYWFITDNSDVRVSIFENDDIDKFRITSRNAFKTKEEALRKLEILNFIHENEHRFSDDEWGNLKVFKWCIMADGVSKCLQVTDHYSVFYGNYYFKDHETAQKVADFIGYDDFVKYL